LAQIELGNITTILYHVDEDPSFKFGKSILVETLGIFISLHQGGLQPRPFIYTKNE
jgi:hypothetical protein